MKTLQQFQNHPILGSLYRSTRKNLSKIFTPVARARWAHRQIDEHIATLFKDPAVSRHSSCKKGCHACCHSQVSVNKDEIEILAHKVLRQEVVIDLDRLARQKEAGDDAAQWYKIDYHTRGCVFLDESGACRVYADRPGVCRTNYAVSAPELCATDNGIELPQRLLNTHAADMVLAGAFHASGEGGALPRMLWQAIERLQNKKKSKKRTPTSKLAQRSL